MRRGTMIANVRTIEQYLDGLVEQLDGLDADNPRQDGVRLAIEARICDVERELLARGT